MTGYRSQHFRHSCQNGARCYIEQLPEWDDIIDMFPRGIHPTDIDGMVEINDHFLFMEEKDKSVVAFFKSEGQSKALRALAKRERVTVCFFRPGGPKELRVLILANGQPGLIQDWTRQEFFDWLREWVEKAEADA